MINRRSKAERRGNHRGTGRARSQRSNVTVEQTITARSFRQMSHGNRSRTAKKGKVRYAVVGLGHIAQTAVLPAFAHASKNSALVALVSGDQSKGEQLQRKYKVPQAISYDEYDSFLDSGDVDAVFIAEPNSLHRNFSVRAAEAGVHVLCEKPLAVTEDECQQMIQAARRNGVKLMTAYRLHFEKANLEAIELVHSGKIGEPRFFSSVFGMQAKDGNIRLQKKMGGGTLYDLGVYCINAARYLFRSEPVEVTAFTANSGEKRFREVEEMIGAMLRFPGERLATFICSFGSADTAAYDLIGTKGTLHVKNAYEYAMPVEWELAIEGKVQSRKFPRRDQFGPELVYFSNCILKNKEPEPSGVEGLNDVHIVRALYQSANNGTPVRLKNLQKKEYPGTRQEITRPPVKKPKQVRAENPTKD